MAYLVPALHGRMGSTDYYQANMVASHLAAIATTASELPDWNELSIFVRFQRDIDEKRVREQIVPYLVRTRDRFFGSLIVLVFEPEVFKFESAPKFMLDLPSAYSAVSDQMGFLSIEGGRLVVLDGQHRLVALKEVVTAGDELAGEYRDAVASDELCVIFIHHESFEKTRRIFNKVNRYAKPTSPSDNIITSEDDGPAIIARWLLEIAPPLGLTAPLPPLSYFHPDADASESIVEWRSTKLETGSEKLCTLHAVYETIPIILAANGILKFDEKHLVNRPSDEKLRSAYSICAEWWSEVIEGMKPMQMAIADLSSIPKHRKYQEPWSLIFRPVAQVALFHGLAGAYKLGMPIAVAVSRTNGIDWCAAADHWRDVIIRANGQMIASQSAKHLAGRLIEYLIARELMKLSDIDLLRSDLRRARFEWSFELPET